MTKFDPKAASVDELIARFVSLGLEQEEMELAGNGSRANRAIRARWAVENELKSRDGDARRLLVRFYEHESFQVQCNTASATIALFPEQARRKLEYIRNGNLGLTSMDAGTTLSGIDSGRYVPE